MSERWRETENENFPSCAKIYRLIFRLCLHNALEGKLNAGIEAFIVKFQVWHYTTFVFCQYWIRLFMCAVIYVLARCENKYIIETNLVTSK